ncbi:MAG: hypothetical protein AB1485_08920 [Candidatus Thermoplasmatota archaeon]
MENIYVLENFTYAGWEIMLSSAVVSKILLQKSVYKKCALIDSMKKAVFLDYKVNLTDGF